MTCPDLLLEHDPGDAALAHGVAAAFQVRPEAVRVVAGNEVAAVTLRPTETVLVERWPFAGQAAVHLQVFPQDDRGESCAGDESATILMIRRLAHAFNTAVLTPDRDRESTSWLRVLPSGVAETVQADEQALDNERRLIVLETVFGRP